MEKIKAGLEIHQQLDTHKLFCDCPSLLRNDEPQKTIERKLNAVVGETGEIDAAAKHEQAKEKKFVYEVYDTNCLIELDEEPPHEINKEALKIALQIAILMKCKIFPVSQIMRKTVVDGSNTSGFQRTVLIAHDGEIETSKGKVRIETIALEEDAARKTKDEKGKVHFKLDRLGIPLVEITTKPDMNSPEQIKEAALKIGEILRACKVKRGIGTIRQDLNISTENHPRIEIKGFQDPKIMIKTIETETKRQAKADDKTSHVRKSNPDGTTEFLRPMPGAARMYPETDCPLLKISRELINEAKKNLPKLLSENKSYLKEFGLNEDLVSDILKQNKLEDFKALIEIYKNPKLIGKILTIFMKDISAKSNKSKEELDNILSLQVIETILENVKSNKISEGEVKEVLDDIAEGKNLKQALKREKVDISKEIKEIIQEKPGLSPNAYMGLIMSKFKGKVSPKDIMENIKKLI
jgi:Glu-tRNA(Gln) amidotransferase subunit E-like FAD-binding protein